MPDIDEMKTHVKNWKSFAKKAQLPAKQVEMIGRMHLTRL